MKVQETVKKETAFVAAATLFGCAAMLLVFYFLHKGYPDKIPFDYRVPLSAFLGFFIATLNFFWMGMTVQGIVSSESQEGAYQKLRLSYRYRMLMQLLWIVLCMVAPCFQIVAGIIPLILPSVFIKARGILQGVNKK